MPHDGEHGTTPPEPPTGPHGPAARAPGRSRPTPGAAPPSARPGTADPVRTSPPPDDGTGDVPTSASAALGVPATPSSARAAALNPRLGRTAALVAAVLGLGHAAVSAYWLAGGTALLDTIGGDIEEWGRARPWTALVVIAVVVVVKTVVALAAPAYAALGRGRLADRAADAARRPAARALGWIAAGVLTCYGAVLTVAGLLMQAGVLEASADADDRVLAWHTYLWDPWFLAWGLALGVTLAATRRPTTRRGAGGSATSAR